jgi:purine-binding chemotaxis protein CheW
METNAIDPTQYLTFRMAKEECAVPVLRVKEILEYDTPTRVPSTPEWIRGVINLRGGVVPVVDLALKFGLPESQITKKTCIVIVEIDQDGHVVLTGVVAETVSQVVEIGRDDIQPPPSFGAGIRVDYILGMAAIDRKFALLLDIDRVLSSDELLVAKATGAAPQEELVAQA